MIGALDLDAGVGHARRAANSRDAGALAGRGAAQAGTDQQANAAQRELLDETLDADMEAISREIEALQPAAPASAPKRQPNRAPLSASLPRREIRNQPENTTCACGCQMKRVGQDVAEKLDSVPGVFTVERHVIDKGTPTTGQHAVATMSLIHSARMNGHDPYAYLRDVLERLPTQPASRIDELLSYRWVAPAA